MVADGKLQLLEKMIQACYDDYAVTFKKQDWNPVLLFINEAKFYQDVDMTRAIFLPKFLVIALNKVASYKVRVKVGNEVLAEACIGFGEG